MAATAVTRAQNRAIAKGTDPKAATCRAKLQRARSALNRQMDRELRLREGAENLLRATTKDGGGDSVGLRNKSKNRKLIRQTVALELSFLESNVRLLADELAELNGSVDVYQHRDEDDDVDGESFGLSIVARRHRRRQRQMPMIAVPLKDTRPIDFGPPLERFIGQHYGVDLSATSTGTDNGEGENYNDGNARRRLLSLREAVDELTQLRVDTQTPSRDADGVRLLLRYYRQLYYVDRRFFPPSPTATPTITTTPRQCHQQQQDNHNRQNKYLVPMEASPTPPPAIYFEWYDSFGGPVPSCGQRTVRFEQACVLFNVAAVHTQMGAKHDRRCFSGGGGGSSTDDDEISGTSGKPASASSYMSASIGPEPSDGATAAAQCFLRAAGAYRHIGETFANAPARAADLRATGVLYTVMMAQAHECIFEKTQRRLLASVRHRCRRNRNDGTEESGHRRKPHSLADSGTESNINDRRNRGAQDSSTRRTSMPNEVTTTHTPSWTELAREAAHVSRMYAEVVYNSNCRPNESVGVQGGKENGGGEHTGAESALPEVWVSVCQIKDRHYAALAYRYAACALLPYYRRAVADSSDDRNHYRRLRQRDRYVNDNDEADVDADELLTELTTAAATAGLEVVDEDQTTSSPTLRQERRRKQLGKLLLEAAAAAHDRAARALRLCHQLRGAKAEGSSSGSGGGGLLAGVLDWERHRTVRLLMLHRRDDDEYGTAGDDNGDEDDDKTYRCCCRRGVDVEDYVGQPKTANSPFDFHDCCSDDECVDEIAMSDYGSGSGDQDEFTAAGIAGIPGLDIDRGVLIRPRTKLRLMSIAPDFTDTGDNKDNNSGAWTTTKRLDDDYGRQRPRQEHVAETADAEERRADLFAGLGPVAVFSARHRCTRPRWVKIIRSSRHRSAGTSDVVAAVCGGDDDDGLAITDPIELADQWFGFELRSHGGGTAAAAPPATVGHVRSNSQAQLAGLRRGDIVVAIKCQTGDGGRVLDVRWETCRRVAELIVRNHKRRRQQNSGDMQVQLKVVTPITAANMASDVHAMVAMDPNKMYSRRRPTSVAVMTSSLHSTVPPPPHLLPQPTSKQQRRQWRQNTNGGNETADNVDKMNSWSWNPFRRRRRSVVGNNC